MKQIEVALRKYGDGILLINAESFSVDEHQNLLLKDGNDNVVWMANQHEWLFVGDVNEELYEEQKKKFAELVNTK